MSAFFLVQLLISVLAVALMVGLAAWIGLPRVKGALTEDQVRAVLSEDHPELVIDSVSLASDGRTAEASAGGLTLCVKRVGDGHVVQTA